MMLVLFAMCCLYATMDVQGIPQIGKNKPRTLMNSKELIRYHGYPCEEHDVVTQDGYILRVFRIPHGRQENASTSPKPAVLLQHGMLGGASDWIFNSPDNSLGFVLADNGCDVWLGNSRGSQWSKRHVSLSTEDENFWAFSFDHMAQYDLPAAIDFILQKTGQQQLFYIGHSQGSTIGFIAFSTVPHLARKIKINFALAPVISVKHAIPQFKNFFTLPDFIYKVSNFLPCGEYKEKGISLRGTGLEAYFKKMKARKLENLLTLSIQRSYLALRNLSGKEQYLMTTLDFVVCSKTHICATVSYATYLDQIKRPEICQVDEYEVNPFFGTSVQNLIHWSQVLKSGKLQAYDYGTLRNLERYEKTHPPEYNVTNMNVATAVWNVGNDGLANPEDIALLLPQITNLTYHKFIPEWNHVSFIYGWDASVQLYSEILNMIQGSQ